MTDQVINYDSLSMNVFKLWLKEVFSGRVELDKQKMSKKQLKLYKKTIKQ